MTDAEFLNILQVRAATSFAPLISVEEYKRLETISGRKIGLVTSYASAGYAVAPDSLYGAIRLCRRVMAEQVKARLTS